MKVISVHAGYRIECDGKSHWFVANDSMEGIERAGKCDCRKGR